MDQVDIADRLITDFLEKAILAARGVPTQKSLQSAKTCMMCDYEIPDMRRIAIPGCQRCVSCEDDFERFGNKKVSD